jgi:hypothetical protein
MSEIWSRGGKILMYLCVSETWCDLGNPTNGAQYCESTIEINYILLKS